jgi:Protein of unknown function (DUF3224)
MMRDGTQTLHDEVVLGSGDGDLDSVAGTLHVTVEDDGTHRYEVEYDF